MPRGIPRAGQSSYDSKTNEPASLRRSRFQGRTLTSTWGKFRGWLKGVNFQRRLIHVLAPLTSFRRCFGCVPFPSILTLLFRLLENGLSSVEIPPRKLIGQKMSLLHVDGFYFIVHWYCYRSISGPRERRMPRIFAGIEQKSSANFSDVAGSSGHARRQTERVSYRR